MQNAVNVATALAEAYEKYGNKESVRECDLVIMGNETSRCDGWMESGTAMTKPEQEREIESVFEVMEMDNQVYDGMIEAVGDREDGFGGDVAAIGSMNWESVEGLDIALDSIALSGAISEPEAIAADNVIDGIEYPDDPFETVEELRRELSNLKQIVSLLKQMD